jgi:hypothetical protein
VEQVGVVEDEEKRQAARAERACGARGEWSRIRRLPLRREQAKESFVERLDPVDRGADVLQEDERVVVALVDRNPGNAAVLCRGPLGEERRLAVAGTRDDADDARRLSSKPVHERRSCDDALAKRRRSELRLDHVEARPLGLSYCGVDKWLDLTLRPVNGLGRSRPEGEIVFQGHRSSSRAPLACAIRSNCAFEYPQPVDYSATVLACQCGRFGWPERTTRPGG